MPPNHMSLFSAFCESARGSESNLDHSASFANSDAFWLVSLVATSYNVHRLGGIATQPVRYSRGNRLELSEPQQLE